jgi:hypothetical protein
MLLGLEVDGDVAARFDGGLDAGCKRRSKGERQSGGSERNLPQRHAWSF